MLKKNLQILKLIIKQTITMEMRCAKAKKVCITSIMDLRLNDFPKTELIVNEAKHLKSIDHDRGGRSN